jgi:hypothetical protein
MATATNHNSTEYIWGEQDPQIMRSDLIKGNDLFSATQGKEKIPALNVRLKHLNNPDNTLPLKQILSAKLSEIFSEKYGDEIDLYSHEEEAIKDCDEIKEIFLYLLKKNERVPEDLVKRALKELQVKKEYRHNSYEERVLWEVLLAYKTYDLEKCLFFLKRRNIDEMLSTIRGLNDNSDIFPLVTDYLLAPITRQGGGGGGRKLRRKKTKKHMPVKKKSITSKNLKPKVKP